MSFSEHSIRRFLTVLLLRAMTENMIVMLVNEKHSVGLVICDKHVDCTGDQ